MKTRILFLHGLESGINGHKVRVLRSCGYDVHAINMQPLIRYHIRIIKAVVLFLILIIPVMLFLDIHVVTIILTIITCVFAVIETLQKLLQCCTDLAYVNLVKINPDLLMGSSWGGAVLMKLIEQEGWKGHSVIIASAHGLVAKYITFCQRPMQLPDTFVGPLSIVHGKNDTLCNVLYAAELYDTCQKAGIESYLFIENDNHAMRKSFVKSNLQKWISSDLTRPNTSPKLKE